MNLYINTADTAVMNKIIFYVKQFSNVECDIFSDEEIEEINKRSNDLDKGNNLVEFASEKDFLAALNV